jgi:hypothetical protein
MRTIPEMIDGLRALAGLEVLRHHAALLDDAANYVEGASSSLREHMQMLQEMRVRLEQVRPLMEGAASTLEDLIIEFIPIAKERRRINQEMELTNAIRAMLRWWEPGTAEPVSISHWGIVE